MGMKEDVGIMEGKKFMCHFCPSACVMELHWEVKGLREELNVVTDKLKVGVRVERVRRPQVENRTGSMTGSEKVTCDSVGETFMSGEGDKPTVCHLYPRAEVSDMQSDRGKNCQISRLKEPRKSAKQPQVYGRCGGLEKGVV